MSAGLNGRVDGSAAHCAHRGCMKTPSAENARVGWSCALAGRWSRRAVRTGAPLGALRTGVRDREGPGEHAQAGDGCAWA